MAGPDYRAQAAREAAQPATPEGENPWYYPELTATTNNWVDAGYADCGKPEQSPIALSAANAPGVRASVRLNPADLSVAVRRATRIWEQQHHNFGFVVGNAPTGTIAITDEAGQVVSWTLVDYHFHTPAEHVDALGPAEFRYGLELHMKSASNRGSAVFAVRFAPVLTGGSEWFKPLLESAEGIANPSRVNLGAVLKNFESKPFFAYNGSLTTPDCTRSTSATVVQWYVLESPEPLNFDSLSRWQAALGKSFSLLTNARTPQTIGTRTVKRYNAP